MLRPVHYPSSCCSRRG